MAVAVGRAALDGGVPDRVIVVSREAGSMAPGARAVMASGLGLPEDVEIEEMMGGAASAAGALMGSAEGTLLIAVEAHNVPSASAILTGPGTGIVPAGRANRGMPIAVSEGIHDDSRFLRQRAWRPLANKLAAGVEGQLCVVGIPQRIGRDLVETTPLALGSDLEGAPAPFFAASTLLDQDITGRVIALDGGSAAAFDLTELGWRQVRVERSLTVPLPGPPLVPAEVTISLSAYERAFESRVGMKASRCECGELSLPPRSHCLRCGRQNATTLVELPHSGEVYSAVTVRVPLPGLSIPYSLAIVAIADTPLRLLAPVTDAPAGSVAIGDRGELVLRRLSTREGIPDYGYAFQPIEGARN